MHRVRSAPPQRARIEGPRPHAPGVAGSILRTHDCGRVVPLFAAVGLALAVGSLLVQIRRNA